MNTVVNFVKLNFSKNHLTRFDALFKTYPIHVHTLECHALLINNDTCPMSFFYENFGYSHMGPWNEVVQNLKGIFQNRAHDGTSEPQDESLFLKKSCTTRPKLANDELALKFACLK